MHELAVSVSSEVNLPRPHVFQVELRGMKRSVRTYLCVAGTTNVAAERSGQAGLQGQVQGERRGQLQAAVL